MADLNDINAAEAVKIVGSNSTGVEQTPVQSTNQGAMHVNLRDNSGIEKGVLGNPVVVEGTVTQNQSGIVNDGSLWSVSNDINAASSGVNNPLLLIKNPVGSGKDIYIWRGRIGSVVTNTSMLVRFYINPTVTVNGTALNPVNRNVGGTNPASIAETYQLPTVSSNGIQITTVIIGQNTLSADINEEFAIRLRPGNSMLITGSPSSNNRAAAISLVWQEIVYG